jgi:hypothetical protein
VPACLHLHSLSKYIKRHFIVALNFIQSLYNASDMTNVKICSVFLLMICTSNIYAIPVSSGSELSEEKTDNEAKGILDGATAKASTTTAAPGGLGGLPNIGQNVANAGPMLIIGGFQAVVTKFDPGLIQGLPGMSNLPPIPGKK